MAKEVTPKEIVIYETEDGREPFSEWLEGLSDKKTRARIRTRLDRVSLGNLGVYRSVGAGVVELIEDFGPGYRIYCGQEGETVVVLLTGGAKDSQQDDIEQAHEYWADYRRRGNA